MSKCIDDSINPAVDVNASCHRLSVFCWRYDISQLVHVLARKNSDFWSKCGSGTDAVKR
jgi:hypothetical protein